MGERLSVYKCDLLIKKFVVENDIWHIDGDMYTKTVVSQHVFHLVNDKGLIKVNIELHNDVKMEQLSDSGDFEVLYKEYTIKYSKPTLIDDNVEIMKLLHERLTIGKERYGHGVIVDDDTRKYGTQDNNWETMMMEEALDGMIYAAAQLIRINRMRSQNSK